MKRKEIQAQIEHPKLYALHQHAPIRLLGRLVHGKERKRAPRRRPRVERSTYYGSRTPRTVVVHVYSGATVHLNNV